MCRLRKKGRNVSKYTTTKHHQITKKTSREGERNYKTARNQ